MEKDKVAAEEIRAAAVKGMKSKQAAKPTEDSPDIGDTGLENDSKKRRKPNNSMDAIREKSRRSRRKMAS